MKVFNLLKKNLSLFVFICFSYLDKALVFLLPVIVLYVSQSESAYNDVEYICSIANIVVPFLTFISAYSFYGYKVSDDKHGFVEHYRVYSSLTILFIGIVSLVITYVAGAFNVPGIRLLELYISIRIAFYIFTQYFNSYFRLIDQPIKALFVSVGVNVLSGIALFFTVVLGGQGVLQAFFYPELITAIAAGIIVAKNFKSFRVRQFIIFIWDAVRFAWPVVLSSTAVAFVANYGKVYAYNFLSDYEMYCFSFILRIAMVLQMSHASLISFFSKDIYMKGYTKKVVISYITVMLASLGAVFALLVGYNMFFAKTVIPIDATCFLVLLYTLLHMVGAVLEVNYGRNNKNVYIFIFSAIACAAYLFLIYLVGVSNVMTLALYMVVYMAIYLALLSLGWRKLLC